MAAAGLNPEDSRRPAKPEQQEETEAEARRDEREAELLAYLEQYEAARKEIPQAAARIRLRRILDPIVDPQLKLRAAEALLNAELDWCLRDHIRTKPISRQEFSALVPEFNEAVERIFPSRIGGYEIEEIIGQGEFGRVYLGIDLASKGTFAIKVLFSDFREIESPRINHARVVQAIKTGRTSDGHLFLVMPYIDGGNLAQYLEKNCKLHSKQYVELRQAVQIIRQIAEELVEIHRELIHRDLKPENILVDRDLNVYIADLGMALLQDERQFESARMTTAGTLPYMAPEMLIYTGGETAPKARARPEPDSRPALTAAADLWAVGVIMYQLLINEYPFGRSQEDLKGIYANLGEVPQFPSARRPDLPEGLERICLKCLRIDRKERYGSARQLLEDLNNVAGSVSDQTGSGLRDRERAEREKVGRSPKFVNRDVQERELKDFWGRAFAARPGAAQVYLIPAMDVDCPEFFTERLREDTVERLARSFRGAQRAAVDRVIVSVEPCYQNLQLLQNDMSRELFAEFDALATWDRTGFSAKPLSKLDRLRLPAFVMIEQTIRTDAARPFLFEFLSWYVGTFWAGFRAEARVLVFLHLLVPVSRISTSRFRSLFRRGIARASPYSELEQEINRMLPRGEANVAEGDSGAPVKLLTPLPPIEPADVERWLRRLRVLPSDVGPMVEQLYGNVGKMRRSDVRLTHVYKGLDEIYRNQLLAEWPDRR